MSDVVVFSTFRFFVPVALYISGVGAMYARPVWRVPAAALFQKDMFCVAKGYLLPPDMPPFAG